MSVTTPLLQRLQKQKGNGDRRNTGTMIAFGPLLDYTKGISDQGKKAQVMQAIINVLDAEDVAASAQKIGEGAKSIRVSGNRKIEKFEAFEGYYTAALQFEDMAQKAEQVYTQTGGVLTFLEKVARGYEEACTCYIDAIEELGKYQEKNTEKSGERISEKELLIGAIRCADNAYKAAVVLAKRYEEDKKPENAEHVIIRAAMTLEEIFDTLEYLQKRYVIERRKIAGRLELANGLRLQIIKRHEGQEGEIRQRCDIADNSYRIASILEGEDKKRQDAIKHCQDALISVDRAIEIIDTIKSDNQKPLILIPKIVTLLVRNRLANVKEHLAKSEINKAEYELEGLLKLIARSMQTEGINSKIRAELERREDECLELLSLCYIKNGNEGQLILQIHDETDTDRRKRFARIFVAAATTEIENRIAITDDANQYAHASVLLEVAAKVAVTNEEINGLKSCITTLECLREAGQKIYIGEVFEKIGDLERLREKTEEDKIALNAYILAVRDYEITLKETANGPERAKVMFARRRSLTKALEIAKRITPRTKTINDTQEVLESCISNPQKIADLVDKTKDRVSPYPKTKPKKE